ncbi:MAG: hypothetical protein WCG05_02815 [Alphaproteobacteria bacterium]
MLYNDLPLKSDPANRFLPWIVALMVYLATLSLVIAFSVSSLIQQWETGFQSHITIEIPSNPMANPGSALQDQVIQDTIALLEKIPEVGKIKILSAHEILKNLNTSTNFDVMDDQFLPRLIDIEIVQRNDVALAQLKENLRMISSDIIVEDHLDWKEGLFELAQSTQIISFLILGIIIAATMGTIAFTSQTSLIIHRHIIEVLYLMGATDRYIAKQFQNHTLRIGAKGGIYGFIFSLLTFFLLNFLAKNMNIQILNPLLSNIGLWGVSLVVPLFVTFFMMLSARATVRLTLKYMV